MIRTRMRDESADDAARRRGWIGYVWTLALGLLLTLGLVALYPHFPLGRYPIPYVLLIMLIAYLFGEGPAILAFVLGTLAFDYFFVPPIRSLWPIATGPSEWAGYAAFLMGTSIVGFATVLMRRSRRQIERLLADLRRELAERERAEEALRESEEEQIAFYRRTIAAATGGKLIVTERAEIERIAGPAISSWEIRTPGDIRVIREAVERVASDAGFDQSRCERLGIALGEAITNVIKHAGTGEASVHRLEDGLIVVISDHGPGIPALALPDVALTRGYSTAGTLGIGYKVMMEFADRVYLATGDEGTTVGLVMMRHPPETSLAFGGQPTRSEGETTP